MNLIQYRLTDKPRFFGLIDVPEHALENDYYLIKEQIDKAFKLCESKALEIVNPGILNIAYTNDSSPLYLCDSNSQNVIELKHNDTFPVPDGLEFNEEEEYYTNGWAEGTQKVIRLSKKEEKEDDKVCPFSEMSKNRYSEEVNKKPDTKTAEETIEDIKEFEKILDQYIYANIGVTVNAKKRSIHFKE